MKLQNINPKLSRNDSQLALTEIKEILDAASNVSIKLKENNIKYRRDKIRKAIMYGKLESFLKADEVRQQIAKFISSNDPILAVTLTLSDFIPQKYSRELLNSFCYKFNKMMLGKQFTISPNGNSKAKQIPIFAVRENAETVSRNRGKDRCDCDHYHLTICRNPFKNKEFTLDQYIEIIFKAIHFANREFAIKYRDFEKRKQFRILTDLDNGLNIQEYYDYDGINWEWYSTKVFESFKLTTNQKRDHFGIYDASIRKMIFGTTYFRKLH